MGDAKYQVLLKIAELGSMTRAAEALGYTQSAISRTIAELEREWGLPLLTRSRSGAALTAEGALLLPYLQGVCNAHRRLEEQIGELHGLTQGTLRLGTLPSIAVHWLPGLMKGFLTLYPSIRFELRSSMEYIEIENWVEKGVVDCGFVLLPAREGLETVPLRRDPLLALLPTGHPMSGADSYPLARFALEPFIELIDGRDREIVGIFQRHGIKPNVAYAVNDDYAIISMVENGLGVSLLHELVLQRTPYRVITKPLDPPQFRDLGLAARGGWETSPLVQRFLDYAREQLGGAQPANFILQTGKNPV